MKKLLLLLCILSLQFGLSQNINFPNSNFKSILVNAEYVNAVALNLNLTNYVSIDINNDNEISLEEASNIGGLNIYSADVNDLTGLEFFTNLKSFSIYSESLTSFSFPTLINLENLSFGYNSQTLYYTPFPALPLSSLVLGGNINLKSLSLSSSNLASLDLSNNLKLEVLDILIQNSSFNIINGNPSLRIFNCRNEVPYNFDFSGFPKLIDVTLQGTGATTINTMNNLKLATINVFCQNVIDLDFSNNVNLESVQISSNDLETLNLGSIKYIRYFSVNSSKLTSLDLSNLFNLKQGNCSGNNNLSSLNIKNGIIEEIINFNDCPNLLSICCDENEIVYSQNQCNLLGYTTNVSACIPPPVEARPLTMFPNPVKDMLYLDTTDKINKVEVFGSNGLLIMTSETVTDIIDMQSFQNGMYFLKVYRDNSVDDMKFIKG